MTLQFAKILLLHWISPVGQSARLFGHVGRFYTKIYVLIFSPVYCIAIKSIKKTTFFVKLTNANVLIVVATIILFTQAKRLCQSVSELKCKINCYRMGKAF